MTNLRPGLNLDLTKIQRHFTEILPWVPDHHAEVYTLPIQTADRRLAKQADSTKRTKWMKYWSRLALRLLRSLESCCPLVLPAFGRLSGWGACGPLAPRVPKSCRSFYDVLIDISSPASIEAQSVVEECRAYHALNCWLKFHRRLTWAKDNLNLSNVKQKTCNSLVEL